MVIFYHLIILPLKSYIQFDHNEVMPHRAGHGDQTLYNLKLMDYYDQKIVFRFNAHGLMLFGQLNKEM